MVDRAEVVRGVLSALDACERLCPPARSPDVAVRVTVLRDLFARGPAARVAAVGRRGAGKSSLLNALAGAPLAGVGDVADATLAPRVARVETAQGALLWLDTPGLRAGGREGRLDAVSTAARAFEPTALLVLCASTEVDAGIDEDLDDVAAITRALARPAPIIAASTRVDELAPPDVAEPPFDDAEKRANVARSVSTLHRHMLRRGLAPRVALPVCAFVSWREGALVGDARWNLAPLARALDATRPDDVGRDLAELLRGLCGALVDRVADDAASLSMEAPAPRRGELLASLHESLVRCLDELLAAFSGRRVASLRDTLGRAVTPGPITEVLRGALDGLGARRAGAALASSRVRALGRAVLALESLRPSAEVIDAATASPVA